jgi:hypothetical protein
MTWFRLLSGAIRRKDLKTCMGRRIWLLSWSSLDILKRRPEKAGSDDEKLLYS